MNTCSNCQTEFDGETCPSCNQSEKKSGKKLTAKGYKALSAVPSIAFAVFALLVAVVFALLPVASVRALGVKEKYGTLLSGERFYEIPGLNGLSIGMLIFAVVTIAFAVVILAHRFSVLSRRKVGSKPVYKVLEIVSVAFVLAHLVLAIAVIGRINSADDGLQIIRASLSPILTIILSVACLFLVVISLISCCKYEKANPEVLETAQEEKTAKTENKSSVGKKATSYAGKKAIKFLILPIIVIVLFTLVGNKIIARFEAKPFEVGELKKIAVADAGNFEINKYGVESKVGKSFVPNGATEDQYNLVYYTENYTNLIGKMERNQKFALLAIETADKRISGLLKQAKNLQEELETLAYGQAKVAFGESGYLKSIVYNNVVIDGFSGIDKKLDKVEIYKVNEKVADENAGTKTIEKVAYLATYADGSFIYGTSANAKVLLADGTTATTYEGSYAGKTLVWEDEFGKYQVVA